MANEKFTIVKDRKNADVTIKQGQKVFVEDSKKDSGRLMIFAIICFFISPLLVFKAMPLYGKLLSVLYLLGSIFLILEPRCIKSKISVSSKYYLGIRIYQKISYALIGATYLFFCRNCFVQFINYRKYDYINANFLFAIKWLYICSSATLVILLITRILSSKISSRSSIKETITDEKIFIIFTVCFLILTLIFGTMGIKANETSSKKGPVLTLNGLTYVETTDNNVTLAYSIHNNTKGTIHRLKNIHVRVTNDADNVVAEKTFESVSTGWLEKHEDATVRFTFDFPNDADITYFKSTSEVSLTTEISNYYLD